MRHLVLIDLGVRRMVPATLFQIAPQFASGSERHMTIDALVRSNDGEDIDVNVEDEEASPTCGSAVTCAQPLHFHLRHRSRSTPSAGCTNPMM
jgi:hypothetical protein